MIQGKIENCIALVLQSAFHTPQVQRAVEDATAVAHATSRGMRLDAACARRAAPGHYTGPWPYAILAMVCSGMYATALPLVALERFQ